MTAVADEKKAKDKNSEPEKRIIRCPECHEMFPYTGMPPKRCPRCDKHHEELFERVRRTVQEHPGINAVQLTHMTDVPVEIILKYIDEGRIDAMPHA